MRRRRWVRTEQPNPRGAGFWLGVLFSVIGIGVSIAFYAHRNEPEHAGVLEWLSMIAFVVVGLLLVRRGIRKGNHAKWLRENGVPRSAEVIDAQRTGAEVGDIPLFSLTLEVETLAGTYRASVIELLPPENVDVAVGSRVRVLVSPRDPKDVWLDDVES